VITYGTGDADVRARDIVSEGFELRFVVSYGGQERAALVPLLGRFNAHNALAAVAVALSQGVGLRAAVEALASFPGVPGRMERIDAGQPFAVFVDIASTAAALENVLTALRPATPGRLWAVFGAAGARDPARRSGMGEVAARLADRCVLTNEDPRQEEPEAIIEAIAVALTASGRVEGRDFRRIPDRRAAIQYAFEQAAPGDTVLLAGKATETTMVFAQGAVPWDERATARELLA
jgi:UDP-N-acetylmuramoyl-L-alanyl-D-glutamate--2,6-diaminopimelate ligase